MLVGCEKPPLVLTPAPVQTIDPVTYLPTISFDGTDWIDKGESNFPISFNFNTHQDANLDGSIDVEDNLENLVLYSIGDNINGTGRTGKRNRQQNDQSPSVYFHFVQTQEYDVYEYWLYYADNDWINDHEHDWEKYFVYVRNGAPKYVKLSHHNDFNTYGWSEISTDNGHPMIGVDGGSHAMKKELEDGVQIKYSGLITKNAGRLDVGNSETIPWRIYTNDNVTSGVPFATSVEKFYYGDAFYFGSQELDDERVSPWMRPEWNNPPNP